MQARFRDFGGIFWAMLVMMESCWLSKASGLNMYLLSLFPNEVLLLPDN